MVKDQFSPKGFSVEFLDFSFTTCLNNKVKLLIFLKQKEFLHEINHLSVILYILLKREIIRKATLSLVLRFFFFLWNNLRSIKISVIIPYLFNIGLAVLLFIKIRKVTLVWTKIHYSITFGIWVASPGCGFQDFTALLFTTPESAIYVD